MRDITEQEIVAAAKAMATPFFVEGTTWDTLGVKGKWAWLRAAYLALRAADAARERA